MRKTLFLSLLLAALTAGALWADEAWYPRKFRPAREVLVPFEDLPVLLEEKTNRVLLTRAEYNDQIGRAHV